MSSFRTKGIAPRVRGAIFQLTGERTIQYFKKYTYGVTGSKSLAHVYTREEVVKIRIVNPTWAPKCQGKWVLVYE